MRDDIHTGISQATRRLVLLLALLSAAAGTFAVNRGQCGANWDGVPVPALYREGVGYFDAGRYYDAIKVWQYLLDERGRELTRKQRMALLTRINGANLAMSRNPEANSDAARAARAFDQGKTLFDKAVKALRDKNTRATAPSLFDRCVTSLQLAESLGYRGTGLDHMMAFACLQLDRLSQGWVYLDRTIKANPSDPRPLNLKAEYLARRGGRLMQRISVLKRSLALDPKQRAVHRALCLAYLKTRRKKYLPMAYEHAVAAAGSDPEEAGRLAAFFPGEYKNKLDELAARLAVDKERSKLPKRPSWNDSFGEGRVSSTVIRVP